MCPKVRLVGIDHESSLAESTLTILVLNPVGAVSESDFKCAPVFEEVKRILNQDGGDIVKKIKGTYLFKVKNAAGQQTTWFVNAKDKGGSVYFGSDKKADCTITMSDADMLGMMTGTLNAQKAFMQGKLKISGNMALAMKLKELQPPKAKL